MKGERERRGGGGARGIAGKTEREPEKLPENGEFLRKM